MLYVHTIGRIGKDCQVITGAHGSFIAFDIAVDDYSHGNSVTTWVRVRSKKENHIRLAEYLTKGRLLLIEGTLSASLWKDKSENYQIQLSITADALPENGKAHLLKRAARRMLQTRFRHLRLMHRRTTRTTCLSDKVHTSLIASRY
mgnify:CR=1 FL=1